MAGPHLRNPLPAPLVRGNHDGPGSWLDFLDDEAFESAGLTKLTDEELAYLGTLWIHLGGPSFLEAEGQAYLERNRWRPVCVGGPFRRDGNRWVVVWGDDGPALLEAWSILEPLPPPGVHWGKEAGGSWDILGPDGVSRHYVER